MTNKKFKMAAMSLALTACVAASPLAANAETPENASDANPSAAVQHENEPEEADAEDATADALPDTPEEAPAEALPEETLAEEPSAEQPEEETSTEEAPAEQAPAEQPQTDASAAADAPESARDPDDTPAAPAVLPATAGIAALPAQPQEKPVAVELPGTDEAPAAEETPASTDADAPQISLLVPREGIEVVGSAATTGGIGYGTLQDAIDAANEGADVILNRDHEGFVEIVKSIILDLGGNKIIAPAGSGKAAITVDIKDSPKDAPGLIIKNGTVTGGEDSGIKIKGSTVDVTLDGLEITGNTGTSGGGVYAKNSTVTITDSNIHDNVGKMQGGGVYAESCELTVSGSTIQANDAAKDAGGGIYLKASQAEITGNTISDNTSLGGGGGIYSTDPSGTAEITSTLTDNDITGNATDGFGGGILVANNGQTFLITGGTISGNKARSGGGIGMTSGSQITVDGTAITGNTASSYGGGIYTNSIGGTLTLKDASIQGNHASQGGGVYLQANRSELTADSSTVIAGNTASKYGGGICGESNKNFGYDQHIDLSAGSLYNNHASLAGDDLYLPALKRTTLTLRPVGDGWVLDECGHTIDGWYLDGEDARWNADGTNKDLPKFAAGLDSLLADATVQVNDDGTFSLVTPDGHIIRKYADGRYELQTTGTSAVALKAAHAMPAPAPDPVGPTPDDPTPAPPEENTPILPEEPVLPPVQDARFDADAPVQPKSPVLPAVQDAHALPQTGTSLFAALAMALSGFALITAGTSASLTGKNARH